MAGELIKEEKIVKFTTSNKRRIIADKVVKVIVRKSWTALKECIQTWVLQSYQISSWKVLYLIFTQYSTHSNAGFLLQVDFFSPHRNLNHMALSSENKIFFRDHFLCQIFVIKTHGHCQLHSIIIISSKSCFSSPSIHLRFKTRQWRGKKLYKVNWLLHSKCDYNFSKRLRRKFIIISFLQCHVVMTIND